MRRCAPPTRGPLRGQRVCRARRRVYRFAAETHVLRSPRTPASVTWCSSPTAQVAFIEDYPYGDPTDMIVRKAALTGHGRLDCGADIAPDSLQLTGNPLSWTRGGADMPAQLAHTW